MDRRRAPPPPPPSEPPAPSAPTPGAWSPETPIDDGWPTLDEITLRYVVRVLDHLHDNKTRAADLLGVDRRTVSRLAAAARAGAKPVIQTQRRRTSKRPERGDP